MSSRTSIRLFRVSCSMFFFSFVVAYRPSMGLCATHDDDNFLFLEKCTGKTGANTAFLLLVAERETIIFGA